MLKSMMDAMLTNAMGFAWRQLMRTGERFSEVAERRAGLSEVFLGTLGQIFTSAGEHLEYGINWVGVRLGYYDGEVSSMAAWPR